MHGSRDALPLPDTWSQDRSVVTSGGRKLHYCSQRNIGLHPFKMYGNVTNLWDLKLIWKQNCLKGTDKQMRTVLIKRFRPSLRL